MEPVNVCAPDSRLTPVARQGDGTYSSAHECEKLEAVDTDEQA